MKQNMDEETNNKQISDAGQDIKERKIVAKSLEIKFLES